MSLFASVKKPQSCVIHINMMNVYYHTFGEECILDHMRRENMCFGIPQCSHLMQCQVVMGSLIIVVIGMGTLTFKYV